MKRFFSLTSEPIPIGGPDHLMYIALLVLTAALLIGRRRWVRDHARQVRIGVLITSVVQQTLMYGVYVATGWGWAEVLPLHISRVSALLCVVYLVTGSKRLMDVLFYFSLWAWFSFSYPQSISPITNLFGWSFLINHVITLLMPVLAWVTSDWRPSRSALGRAFAWMVAYSLVALAANAITGGDYFFQRSMPVLASLGQPAYYLGTLLVGLVLFWIGYGVSRLVPVGGASAPGPPAADERGARTTGDSTPRTGAATKAD